MLIKFVTVGMLFARTVGLQETKHLFCLAQCVYRIKVTNHEPACQSV